MTLEEFAGAYLPFALGGVKPEPYAIEWIRTRDDETLYEHIPAAPDQVMTRRVSKDMTHMLYQVVHSGTGRRASLGRRPAAGKTGTTNEWRDAWFMGYTAQLTAGVWVGNDDYRPMDKVTGGSIPAEIWKTFMVSAHQGLPIRSIDGAYPAATYAEENSLLDFYADVSRGLTRVARDGNPRRRRGR